MKTFMLIAAAFLLATALGCKTVVIEQRRPPVIIEEHRRPVIIEEHPRPQVIIEQPRHYPY